MNYVDLIIVVILLLFAYEGFRRSFIAESFELASFLLSFIFALRFYSFAALQLDRIVTLPKAFSNVIGFMLAWFLIETVFLLLAQLIFNRYFKKVQLFHEEWLSIIPAVLRGIILVAVFLVVLGTFPIQPQIKSQIQSSKLGSLILSRTYQLEAPLKNIFGGLAQESLTFLTVKPQTNESLDLGFQTITFDFRQNLEEQMIRLVNIERAKEGQSQLTFNSKLREVARAHSSDMFTRGYFSHYSPEGKTVADRAQTAGVKYLVIGENLAFAPNLELAHQGLMNSPGHRANILSDDYHQIGIGIAQSEDYGLMITQVFSN